MNTNGQTRTADPMAALRARALEIATSAPTRRSGKTPKECACGCGLTTKGGTWRPGHDAIALSRMIAEERARMAAPTADAA